MTKGRIGMERENAPESLKTAQNGHENKGAEAVLARFIAAWRNLDWDGMAAECQVSWVDHNDDPVGTLKGLFQFKPKEIEVLEVEEYDGIVYVARLRIRAAIARGVVQERKVEARLICEEGPLHPSKDGTWGVNPLSLYRVII
jgi:hypothetical protein